MPAFSKRMPSERLKELEVEAILQRAVQPGAPVKFEYTLTKKGHALPGVLEEIGRVAGKVGRRAGGEARSSLARREAR